MGLSDCQPNRPTASFSANIPDPRRIVQREEIRFFLRRSTCNLFFFFPCLRFAEHLNWVKVDIEISLIFNGALWVPHNMCLKANCECLISESQIASDQRL